MSPHRPELYEESELLEYLLASEDLDAAPAGVIRPRREDAEVPLSFAQLRLWSLHQSNPDSPAYNIVEAVRISGPLDRRVLRDSLSEIVRRHEVLRMAITAQGDHPVVHIFLDAEPTFGFEDLSALPRTQRDQAIQDIISRDAARRFDFSQPPLLRVTVLKTTTSEYVVLLCMHHIVADGWSMGVFLREIGEIYSAFMRGGRSPLPELPIQYGDFSLWQHSRREELEEKVRYWTRKLADLPRLSLPLDHSRPRFQTFEGATVVLAIGEDLTASLRAIACRSGASMFMTLLAAFQTLLHRYSGETCIPIGTPVANRDRQELEPLIGFFVNMLVLRGDLSGRLTFLELLQRTRDTALEAYDHREAPFEQVVHALGQSRQPDRNPLFQVVFSLQNAPAGRASFSGLTVAPFAAEQVVSKFDLSLILAETSGGLAGGFEYSTRLFDRTTIDRMSQHFLRLLEGIVRAPESPIACIPFLTPAEETQQRGWNQTRQSYPRCSLATLFERTVHAHANRPAVKFGAVRWTYSELNERANRLAWHLLDRGIRLESLVGISVEEGLDAVLSMVAAIKAGGAYVPLRPSDPRRAHMAAKAGIRLLITTSSFEGLPGVESVLLDHDAARIANSPAINPPCDAEPDNMAYVIHTSGSTGKPKGVAVPQHGVIRLVRNTDYVGLSAHDRVGQASTYAFDAITFEVWGALLNGACLVGIPREVSLSPRKLANHLREQKISTLFLTATLFNGVVSEEPSAFATLDTLIAGGEALTPRPIGEMLKHGAPRRFVNGYGPTETTTFATWHEITAIYDGQAPPIGQPIANSTAYVLDENMLLLPVSVPGELYLGGDGLARGYIGEPAMTAERFLPDPFSGDPGARMYRTGDIVKRRADGAIELIGRADNQIKLRGFRVELGEIEAAIQGYLGVRAAVVVLRDNQRLTAHVAAGPEVTAARLRNHLQQHLPDYMVPSAISVVPELPLNANGKIDRRVFVKTTQEPAAAVRAAPQTAEQKAVAEVWRAVLGQDVTDPAISFWELGGDSIIAIRVISRLQRQGWKVDMKDLLQCPRARDFAACLRREVEPQSMPDAPLATGIIPLTPIQRWFFDEHTGPIHHFNQAILLRSDDRLDPQALQRTLDTIVAHHDMLRARFWMTAHGITQEISGETAAVPLDTHDLRSSPNAIQDLERIANHTHGTLDLGIGPIFRCAHFQMPDGDRLLLVIHHLVVDGFSWRILLEDLFRAWENTALGPKSAPFRTWAESIQRYSRSPALLDEVRYWNGSASIPAEVAPRRKFGTLESISLTLDAEPTAALLRDAIKPFGASPNEILLTALGRSLFACFGTPATWITLESHGRELLRDQIDVSRTVGWFTSLYPFLLDVTGSRPEDQIKAVKESLRNVPSKGIGYGILRYLTPENLRPALAHQDPRISWNYLGQFDTDESSRFRFASESSGLPISPDLERKHEIDIVSMVFGQRLQATFHFDPRANPYGTMQQLAKEFRVQLLFLIEFCRNRDSREKTPFDFTVPCISLAQYQELLQARGWDARMVEDLYPLSPLQAGLLFETLSNAEGHSYFVQVSYTLRGSLDLARFEQAWNQLAQRHTILRTAFLHDGLDKPLQVVLCERSIPFRVIQLAGEAVQQRELEAIETRDRARGFDLERDPLMRVTVVRLNREAYQVIWSYHHLLLDGWCLGILYTELLHFYNAGQIPVPVVAPYGSYVRWLRARDQDAARKFWSEHLRSYEGICGVPRDLMGGASHYLELQFQLKAADSTRLRQAAKRLDVTLNTVIQSIWGLMLARYNDTDDVVFGTIVSGRPSQLPGVENTVGLFINAVPVRIKAPAAITFSQVAAAAQKAAADREPHQYLSLNELTAGHGGPLFDHLLTFENYPLGTSQAGSAGLRIEGEPRIHDRTHYDFSITVFPGNTIDFRIGYDGAQFSTSLVEQIAAHWRSMLDLVVQSPDLRVADIDFITPGERQLLLHDLQPKPSEALEQSLLECFRRNASQCPDSVAVVFSQRALTYRALDALSNRVASGLIRRGCQRGDRIAIVLDRSERVLTAILGVLKAGCAFVPIEPGTPEARVAFMVRDCGARAVIANACLNVGCFVFAPESFDDEDAGPPATEPLGDDTAYVIYTSGSTGQPKGCELTHANLAHYLSWASTYYFGATDGGSFPLFTPLAFDLTMTSLFLPLLRGKTVYVYPQDSPPDEVLTDILRAGSMIDSIKLTPAHMALIEHLDVDARRLRTMIVGGEALPLERVRYCQSLNPDLSIYNEYGPTETTVGCIVSRIGPLHRRVLIGKPIANTTVYILDAQRRLCPIGVTGEIVIGGRGVSRGYVNRTDLNREKFISDPFRPGERLYCTGDAGRWLFEGEIEYLGRRDDQIKIRGYRIEPGEIEVVLRGAPGVSAAVVLPDESRSRLVAFIVGSAASEDLLARLRLFVPEYMLPSLFVRLDELPLTANGKVDKAALLNLLQSTPEASGRDFRDSTAASIAEVWKDVLGVPEIPPGASFFQLGGHSLKAMQASSRIRQTFGARLSLRDFLQNPTVEGLAKKVRASGIKKLEGILPVPWQPDYPLSWAQQRLWLVHRLGGAEVAYNMPRALQLEGDLDVAALRHAFAQITERHEALRTAFREANGEARQQILAATEFQLAYTDLGEDPDPDSQARRIAGEEASTPFDLSAPPLLRARLLRLGPARHVLVLVIHHIIGDGWSMNVFYRELMALYEARRNGYPDPLRPLAIQYKDFACWQVRQPVREEERYWLDRLDGAPDALRLPFDFPPEAERDFSGAIAATVLSPQVVERLEHIAHARSSTLANVSLAVLSWWLYAWTRQDDFCVGVSIAGRDRPEIENLLGFFVNILPIRVRFSKEKEFEELLAEVQHASTEAFDRQHYPFDRLVQLLNPQRIANRQPLVNVIYAFQNFADIQMNVTRGPQPSSHAEVRIGDFDVAFPTAKFDLTFFLAREPEGLRITIEYDTSLFRAQTIEQALGRIRRLFESVVGEVVQ